MYWILCTDDISDVVGKKEHLVQVQPDVLASVSQLVMDQHIWLQHLVGQGHDAVNLSHRSIRVRKIQHIENVTLWKQYERKKKEMLLQCTHSRYPRVVGWRGEKEICTHWGLVSNAFGLNAFFFLIPFGNRLELISFAVF